MSPLNPAGTGTGKFYPIYLAVYDEVWKSAISAIRGAQLGPDIVSAASSIPPALRLPRRWYAGIFP